MQSVSSSSATPKPLPLRLAVLLSVVGLAEGAIVCWGTVPAQAWLPFSGAVPAALLPDIVVGSAIAFALLIGPLLAAKDTEPPLGLPLSKGEKDTELRIEQAAFAALWQALIAGFFLQVTARLAPLDGGGILLAAAVILGVALAAALWAALLPRAYAGLAFAWAVGAPVSAYMLAEVYLWAVGGIVWRVGEPAPVQACVHWLIALSPGTAAVGAIDGALADGSGCENVVFLLAVAIASALAAAWLLKRQARESLPAAVPAAAFAGKDASRV
jgi:hypothetical protein